MDYGFDTVVNRFHTNSLKYDFFKEYGYPNDTLPLWVADMDFPAPPEVRAWLAELAEYGIFGYSEPDNRYYNAVRGWFSSRHNFSPELEWTVVTSGVVFAISAAIRAFTNVGDGVLIQRPVYYPFERLIKSNDRRLVNNPLVYHDGVYSIDFNDFEDKIIREDVKMFILCSPHNPVGRVWSAEELSRMSEICKRHGIAVISDEIHCDFVYPGRRFVPFANICGGLLRDSVICTAPSKTFNLAGLQLANIFIADSDMRGKYKKELARMGSGTPNNCGLAACETAYTHGGPWLDALNEYLRGNLGFVRSTLAERLPEVKLVEPDGTYLLWLDFTGLGLDGKVIDETLKHKAKLWFSSGAMFGPEGSGFQRINVACPRSILSDAMDRMVAAFN